MLKRKLAALGLRINTAGHQGLRMRHAHGGRRGLDAAVKLRIQSEAVVAGDEQHGTAVLEDLGREVLDFYPAVHPDANTSALRYPPGAGHRPWRVADMDG